MGQRHGSVSHAFQASAVTDGGRSEAPSPTSELKRSVVGGETGIRLRRAGAQAHDRARGSQRSPQRAPSAPGSPLAARSPSSDLRSDKRHAPTACSPLPQDSTCDARPAPCVRGPPPGGARTYAPTARRSATRSGLLSLVGANKRPSPRLAPRLPPPAPALAVALTRRRSPPRCPPRPRRPPAAAAAPRAPGPAARACPSRSRWRRPSPGRGRARARSSGRPSSR